MRIILKENIPVYQPAHRLSFFENQDVNKQIEEWLEQGIVRPSSSEYASPIVLVKKKDGTTRLCVDYRKLNWKLVKDRFPLPLIEDVLDRLQGAKVYTTKLMRKGVVIIYMDDLMIPAKDEKEGLEKLGEVLEVASRYGLEMKFKKCQFLRRKVEFLGHVVENGTIRPSIAKTIAIKKFTVPTTVKKVQSFLGLTNVETNEQNLCNSIFKALTNLDEFQLTLNNSEASFSEGENVVSKTTFQKRITLDKNFSSERTDQHSPFQQHPVSNSPLPSVQGYSFMPAHQNVSSLCTQNTFPPYSNEASLTEMNTQFWTLLRDISATSRKFTGCLSCNLYGHKSFECRRANLNNTSTPPSGVNAVHELPSPINMCKDVTIFRRKLNGLVDTGSNLTLLRNSTYKNIDAPPLKQTNTLLTGFGFSRINVIGTFDSEITIDDQIFPVTISVVPNSCTNYDLIIGCDVIKQAHLNISPTGVKFAQILRPSDNANENFIMTISDGSPTFDIGPNVSQHNRAEVE
ncbi:hypothetical protein TNCV_3089521 [Trichonephila clavipes]|nr:hypothetical protein TNCV_3089521 [Trichonephila clavipes]